MIRAVAAAVLLGMLVGCADGAKPSGPDEPDLAVPPTAAAVCAEAARAVPRPSALPTQVPLPPDAVVTGTELREGKRLIVTAVTAQRFRDTLGFMQRAYPAAGLSLAGGEVEDRDAESNFSGDRLVGRWTLREVPGCDGDTLVTVLVAPA
ncbi:hypothetical protein ACGFI9_10035 [Micromonospora sp. NPDC048930]|uniref:hypothetical protein n=1 Tax=Micromonospora sp. NPDC048930 TaxID=3364261 RepID=UPI00371B71E5